MHRVAGIVEDIDTSLREQSAAATDVAQRIEQISVRAEETSAAGGQSSIAAERLEGVAKEMQASVAGFRT